MMKWVSNRLGIRVALLVIVFLSVMVAGGIGYLYRLQSGFLHQQMIGEGKTLSMIGANSIAMTIEEAVDNNLLSIEDVFDRQYEIIPGFSPPKYHTRYDAYLDKTILKFQDEFLENPAVLYAVAMDVNGYIPTHNTRHRQPVADDGRNGPPADRTKHIFADDHSARAAKNQTKGFVQTFRNELGQTVLDISSPIFVKGKHWGCFKVGMTSAATAIGGTAILRSLVIGGLIFLVFSGTVIALIVNRSLKPLVVFSKMAADLADGDVDQKIVFNRKDEIGKVAEALERLRISLKAAIDRLMRRR
ncbi:MAG: HAMP domain-containing protein [Thermodesulfobacteriota bacterium]